MIDPTRVSARWDALDGHLDDVTALRLADGEVVPEAVRRHFGGCTACAARVAAFRTEGAAFAAALALDAAELDLLFQADLPASAAAAAAALGPPSAEAAVPRESPASLAAVFAVGAAGYAAWWALSAAAAPYLAAADELGGRALAAQLLATAAFRVTLAVWQVASAAAQQPWVQAPAVPVLALALLTMAALWLAPRRPEVGLAPAGA